MPITRRTIIQGSLACAACGLFGGHAGAARAGKGGCGVPAPDIPAVETRIVPADRLDSGQRGFRSAFAGGQMPVADARARAVARLSRIYGVFPPFDFYDDGEGGNALAYRPTARFPQGKVAFGLQLYNELMARDPSGASVLIVLAHEFGHIALYLSGQEDIVQAGRPSAKRGELHADFLAGYYMGLRKREVAHVSLMEAGRLIWSIGDEDFSNPDHHGTPDERHLAAEAGFALGFGQGPDFPTAFASATRYIVETYRDDAR